MVILSVTLRVRDVSGNVSEINIGAAGGYSTQTLGNVLHEAAPPGNAGGMRRMATDLAPVVSAYADHLRAMKKHRRDVRISENCLRLMFEELGISAVEALADARDRYREWTLRRQESDKTKHNRRAILSGFLTWLVDREMIEENWALRVKLPRILEQEEPRALTEDEFARLLEVARADEAKPLKPHGYKWVEGCKYRQFNAERSHLYVVARWTGMRESEIKSMRRGWLRVRTAEPHIVIPSPENKGKRIRRVPLLGPALEVLEPYAQGDPDAKVWASWPHYRAMQSDFFRAGITDTCGWHSLRRTMITSVLASGVEPLAVQMVVGHKDLKTTLKHYIDPKLMELGAALRAGAREVEKRVDAGRGMVDTPSATYGNDHHHQPDSAPGRQGQDPHSSLFGRSSAPAVRGSVGFVGPPEPRAPSRVMPEEGLEPSSGMEAVLIATAALLRETAQMLRESRKGSRDERRSDNRED